MINKLVNVLADEGTYLPFAFAQDCGVNTGMMTVLSRPVCVLSVEQQIKHGAEKQVLQLLDKAVQIGTPLILLFSEKETIDASIDIMAVTKALVRLSGVCPLLALVEKEVGVLASALLPYVDFCIYATGAHAGSSSAYQAIDLPAAVEAIRTILSYLPLNCAERAPILKYNGHANIPSVIDPSTAFTIYFDAHARIAFARINGRSVGMITTSNTELPAHAARFIQFCDCYSLPLVLLAEADLVLDEKQSFLLAQATVPLIAIGEMQKYSAFVDVVFASDDKSRENVVKALEFLCVKRDVLPPHKHGNMPI